MAPPDALYSNNMKIPDSPLSTSFFDKKLAGIKQRQIPIAFTTRS